MERTINLIIRGVPMELHRRIRVQAATEGMSGQAYMLSVLKKHVPAIAGSCPTCGKPHVDTTSTHPFPQSRSEP